MTLNRRPEKSSGLDPIIKGFFYRKWLTRYSVREKIREMFLRSVGTNIYSVSFSDLLNRFTLSILLSTVTRDTVLEMKLM